MPSPESSDDFGGVCGHEKSPGLYIRGKTIGLDPFSFKTYLEAFSLGVAQMLAAEPDRIKRQVRLLGWLLEVYSKFPADQVIRYEDMVAAPRRVLGKLFADARDPVREIKLQIPQERYSHVDFSALAKELSAIADVAEKSYPDFAISLK